MIYINGKKVKQSKLTAANKRVLDSLPEAHKPPHAKTDLTKPTPTLVRKAKT